MRWGEGGAVRPGEGVGRCVCVGGEPGYIDVLQQRADFL